MAIDYDVDDPFTPKSVSQKKKGPKLKRCKLCRETVILDGYGEYVHSETGLYFGRDAKGTLDHAAAII